MRFNSLTIKGFRAIQELRLEGLRTINLFVGGNNTGKTSVLEALALSSSPMDPNNWVVIAKRRSTNRLLSGKLDVIERLRWLFSKVSGENKTNEKMVISADTQQQPLEIQASYSESANAIPPEWWTRKRRKFSAEDPMQEPSAEELYRFARIDVQVFSGNDEVQEQFDVWENFGYQRSPPTEREKNSFPCAVITAFSHTTDEEMARDFSRKMVSDKPQLREDLVEMLRSFDSDVLDLEVLTPSGISGLYVQHRRVGLAPSYTFGDGFRRALCMALAIARSRDGILLVDEIETSMHTTLLFQFCRWLVEQCQRNRVQLFITTHSLEAVDALVAAVPEDELVAFRLHQQNGLTTTSRLAGSHLAPLRFELGQEIR